jgi:hypothetical protein
VGEEMTMLTRGFTYIDRTCKDASGKLQQETSTTVGETKVGGKRHAEWDYQSGTIKSSPSRKGSPKKSNNRSDPINLSIYLSLSLSIISHRPPVSPFHNEIYVLIKPVSSEIVGSIMAVCFLPRKVIDLQTCVSK